MEDPNTHKATYDPKWIRQAILLSWFTIIYNLAKGFVSIGFGIDDRSTALIGFGVDSLIEVASAFLVLWRFRGESGVSSKRLSLDRERTATRGIGILFSALAVFTTLSVIIQLRSKTHPSSTVPGTIVSVLSLSFMFYLWSSKGKTAKALNSLTMEKDASCSLACIKLSAILFLGSFLFILFPALWWADGVASLGLSYFIAREGFETYRAATSSDFDGGCGCH